MYRTSVQYIPIHHHASLSIVIGAITKDIDLSSEKKKGKNKSNRKNGFYKSTPFKIITASFQCLLSKFQKTGTKPSQAAKRSGPFPSPVTTLCLISPHLASLHTSSPLTETQNFRGFQVMWYVMPFNKHTIQTR